MINFYDTLEKEFKGKTPCRPHPTRQKKKKNFATRIRTCAGKNSDFPKFDNPDFWISKFQFSTFIVHPDFGFQNLNSGFENSNFLVF